MHLFHPDMCRFETPQSYPCLHPKKADFKINLSGVDVYIELITPFLPLDIEETIQSEPVGFYDPNVGIGH